MRFYKCGGTTIGIPFHPDFDPTFHFDDDPDSDPNPSFTRYKIFFHSFNFLGSGTSVKIFSIFDITMKFSRKKYILILQQVEMDSSPTV